MSAPRNRLIIISAGDFARELAWLARGIPSALRDWDFAGFLDDRPDILVPYPGEGPILGSPAEYEIQSNDRFLCALGDPAAKLRYAGMIEQRGGIFATLIAPGSLVGDRTRIGAGTIICRDVEITTDVTLGRLVTIMSKVIIGHNSQIGDGSVVSSFAFMGGHSKLGTGAFLGPHASLLPKASVGDHAIVGAGSVVLRKVRANTTVFGVPAMPVFIRE